MTDDEHRIRQTHLYQCLRQFRDLPMANLLAMIKHYNWLFGRIDRQGWEATDPRQGAAS